MTASPIVIPFVLLPLVTFSVAFCVLLCANVPLLCVTVCVRVFGGMDVDPDERRSLSHWEELKIAHSQIWMEVQMDGTGGAHILLFCLGGISKEVKN